MICKKAKEKVEERKRKEYSLNEKRRQVKEEVTFAFHNEVCPYCGEEIKLPCIRSLVKKRISCNGCEVRFEAKINIWGYYHDCEIIKPAWMNKKDGR